MWSLLLDITLGLIVPNIISIYRGDHLKHALPHTMMLGSIFVLISDIVGRLIVYPYEINIGLTIGVFGTIIFLILLMKGRRIMLTNLNKSSFIRVNHNNYSDFILNFRY